MIFGTNFQKKVYFRSKTQKNEHRYWILYIRISRNTNFQLKLTNAIFWTKFDKKNSYFQSKSDKIDTTIEFCIFEKIFVSKFTTNRKMFEFWDQICPTQRAWDILWTSNGRLYEVWTLYRRPLDVQRTSNAEWEERYLYSETEKVNIVTAFGLFKLVLVPDFCFNWQLCFFWPGLSKKSFSDLKQKKWTPHTFYIILHIQISLVRNFRSN